MPLSLWYVHWWMYDYFLAILTRDVILLKLEKFLNFPCIYDHLWQCIFLEWIMGAWSNSSVIWAMLNCWTLILTRSIPYHIVSLIYLECLHLSIYSKMYPNVYTLDFVLPNITCIMFVNSFSIVFDKILSKINVTW